jgi:hypothetical protein
LRTDGFEMPMFSGTIVHNRFRKIDNSRSVARLSMN